MICQKCGKYVPLEDTYVVEFKGKLLPINANWIACAYCANEVVLSCYECFGKEYTDHYLKIYLVNEEMQTASGRENKT